LRLAQERAARQGRGMVAAMAAMANAHALAEERERR
jgi:hypothetical protein